MVAPIYWRRRVLSANTIGPYFLCEFSHLEYRQSGSKGWNLSRHRLLIKLEQAEREIGYFTQKLHVQMANSHRSPQSQTNTQPMPSFWPTSFFVTIYLKVRSGSCYPVGRKIETDACNPIGRRIETDACYPLGRKIECMQPDRPMDRNWCMLPNGPIQYRIETDAWYLMGRRIETDAWYLLGRWIYWCMLPNGT
jgi:hypothetical protein